MILAVNSLRKKKKWNLKLTLVGDHYGNELNSLVATIKDLDPNKEWIKYKSKLDRKKLIKLYKQYDLGIFASSCENLSNIILEKISSGLPIVCSNTPSVSFWLKNYKNKFNPLSPLSLEKVLCVYSSSNIYTSLQFQHLILCKLLLLFMYTSLLIIPSSSQLSHSTKSIIYFI